jgi:ubiquinone biosynthesis protein Coq4
MASIFSPLNLKLLATIKSLGDNPADTDMVTEIGDFLYFLAKLDRKTIKKLNLELEGSKEFMKIYRKYLNSPSYFEDDYNLEKLAKYKSGTLAHQYSKYMQKQHLNPAYYPRRNITSPITFLRERLFKTHDIWHLVTGFDVSPTGEFALQAFYLAQFPNIIQYSIMLSPFIRVFLSKENKDIGNLMKIITTGYDMGQAAKPMEYVLWGDKWGENLDDIRKEFNLQKIKPGFFAKYSLS